MKNTIKNIATKFFIAFIAIQIINLSVDAVDFEPLNSSGDLGDFNYMNSMTEYVAEIMLNYKDAFPEYQKESTASKQQIVKHISYKIFHYRDFIFSNSFNKSSNIYETPTNDNKTAAPVKEINPPPPKGTNA